MPVYRDLAPESHTSTQVLPPVVIVGLDNLTGLQSARIFRRRGIDVIGLASDPTHFCCRTRACSRLVQTPTSGKPLIDSLLRLASELEGPAVLLPCTDASVLTLARHQSELPSFYAHDLPDLDTVERLLDKWLFYRYLQQAGLPVSNTFFLKSESDALQAARQVSFPAVLKPAIKTPAWQASSPVKVLRIEDQEALLGAFKRCIRWSDRLVLQEWVPGGDDALFTSNCYLDRNGEMRVGFVSRKVRQWPPGTGSACLARAQVEPEVLEQSRRLFQMTNFRGLGYLEFKRHARTGRYLIIEANVGRPTGRASMAEASGLELLQTKYCDNLGLATPPTKHQKENGCAWLYLRQDLQASIRLWKRGELTFRGWLKSMQGPRVYALESWSDPGPAFFDLVRVAGLAFKNLRSGPQARDINAETENARR